ncbi:MAG: hypothetical protein JST00_35060 [Deltaproteobacteria bacterium]|nr:hypothetical protein [Deltaproteobacteria bacterium]
MHIDLGSGHVFHGTPVEIVAQMKRVAEGVDELDLGEYIDWVIERAATMEGVLLVVSRGHIATRAEALLREMINVGFATDLEQFDDEEIPTSRHWPSPSHAAR